MGSRDLCQTPRPPRGGTRPTKRTCSRVPRPGVQRCGVQPEKRFPRFGSSVLPTDAPAATSKPPQTPAQARRVTSRRGNEGAGIVVFRAVAIEGVQQQIGVERNHRTLLSRGFVGQQTPVFDGSAKRAEIADFGKAPIAVLLRLGFALALNHPTPNIQRTREVLPPSAFDVRCSMFSIGSRVQSANGFGEFSPRSSPHSSVVGRGRRKPQPRNLCRRCANTCHEWLSPLSFTHPV